MSKSTITTSYSNDFNEGDIINLSFVRSSLAGKIIALFVGLFYYSKLDRPLKNFIKEETIKSHVLSVDSETVMTVEHRA